MLYTAGVFWLQSAYCPLTINECGPLLPRVFPLSPEWSQMWSPNMGGAICEKISSLRRHFVPNYMINGHENGIHAALQLPLVWFQCFYRTQPTLGLAHAHSSSSSLMHPPPYCDLPSASIAVTRHLSSILKLLTQFLGWVRNDCAGLRMAPQKEFVSYWWC